MLGKVRWFTILRYSLRKLLITLLSYFLWEVMRYVTFALLFKYEEGLIVFNMRSSIYSKFKSPFTPKSVMNKPQAGGKVNSRLYRRMQEKKVLHSSAIIKQ